VHIPLLRNVGAAMCSIAGLESHAVGLSHALRGLVIQPWLLPGNTPLTCNSSSCCTLNCCAGHG